MKPTSPDANNSLLPPKPGGQPFTKQQTVQLATKSPSVDFDQVKKQKTVEKQPDQDIMPASVSLGTDYKGNGILKNKLNASSQDFDTLSQMSKQIRNLEQEKRKKNGKGQATFNWKHKQGRMGLYKMQKQLNFEDIKVLQIKELTRWSQADSKGTKKTLYLKQVQSRTDHILSVTEQSRLEKLQNYEDRWPILSFRKSIQRIRIYINMFAFKVIKSKPFEAATITVIMVNSITLGREDPLAVSTTPTEDAVENIFLALYSLEMIFKIVGLGFIFNQGAYIRDPWNILDFVIVMSAYLGIFQSLAEQIANDGVKKEVTAEDSGNSGLSLNSLRAFRVLRPLRAVTSIKGLQILVLAVLTSLPRLKTTTIVLMSFFVVFAIALTQLLSGILKKRCVRIDDGVKLDWEDGYYFCGGHNTCPEGYFCGKQNDNPAFNVTNCDNIMFALLVVFQCVTLEGWSDIMIMYQQSYNDLAFILFLPMVFIGAFFLINLLLAVINSSFSETHAEQQQKINAQKAKMKAKKKFNKDDDMAFDESEPINEIGITQYWIAKRVAQRMIAVLRQGQARRAALEIEMQNRLPDEDEEEVKAYVVQMPEPFVPEDDKNNRDVKPETDDSDFDFQIQKLLGETIKGDESKRALMGKEITQYAVNDMRIGNNKKRKIENSNQKILTKEKDKIAQRHTPPGSTKGGRDTKEMMNLDYLLNGNDFLGAQQPEEKNSSQGDHPFDLSFVHSQIADYPDYSDDEPQAQRRARQQNSDEEDQSAIASDSSFNDQLRQVQLDEDSEDQDQSQLPQSKGGVRRIKTQNFNKSIDRTQNGSTQLNQSNTKQETQQELVSQFTMDEKLGKKKKGKKGKTNNPDLRTFGLVDPNDKFLQFKSLMRLGDAQEFITEKKSKNPYEYINKKTHRIEINPAMPYRSTSMEQVFEIRNNLNDALGIEEQNKFIKAAMPANFNSNFDLEMEEKLEDYIKPNYEAYQLKTCYKISMEEEVEFDDEDDDALILALQPYDTVMSVGYGDLLTQKPIKFVARRSDIIVSSTLSITLTPADSEYRPLDKGTLSQEQLAIWCHKRHQFRGLNVICAQLDNIPDDESEISLNYKLKGNGTSSIRQQTITPTPDQNQSAIRQNNVSMMGEGKFNEQMLNRPSRLIPPTLLTKPLPPEKLNMLNDEEKRLYNIQKGKYDTYMRILAKKEEKGELPSEKKFTMQDVGLLLIGKHHEDESEDEDDDDEKNHQMYLGREETFAEQKLNDFEREAIFLLRQAGGKQVRTFGDHLPADVKAEFDLPDVLDDGNQINFNEVIKKDCSRKRNTPLWSGQEVLAIGLNNELSEWVIERINAVRVWPKGWFNSVKKARVTLKIIVKHKLFDSAMTSCVLLNTIVMGMEHYNMSQEMIDFTTNANDWFTWIFIAEMSSKLLAIGPKKYLQDKMNWLDGGVVSISIIEIIMTAAGGGGGNLSAFQTIRVFRTFRVLRVARLLRALKSMKVIISVIARSVGSFAYITMLMFVFVFIYTLLGMQVFGGQFNFEDGKPRGNYDSFLVGFLTVFQVLTTENWNSVLFDSMRSAEVGLIAPVIYYVSWIFIGNWILLNLFLAILLEGFVSEDEEVEGDLEEIERIAKAERKIKIEKEKTRRLKKMGASIIPKSKYAQDWLALKKLQNDEDVDDLDDMDEKMIREIFMDEGLIKKKDKEREKRLLYNGVHCENSMYIFHKKNAFRLICYKIYKHKLFDNTIMFLIALSSIKLAADSYLSNFAKDSVTMQVSDNIDVFMNVCFLFELITKVIALGFGMDDGSYIRETWNQLDCFIVFTSILDMSLTNVDLPVIKILRLLRTLRPLRVISHNIAMKLIVASLFESVGAILNVMIVVVAVWLMFGIFAINIFAGKFFYCSIGKYTYKTKYQCNVNGGSWLRFEQNFDDIFQAMLTLFNVASLEGWPDVMIAAVDTVEEVGFGPEKEASVIMGFFFVVFILIGSFFLMNFFVGVLFMKYTAAAARENFGYTKDHITWIAIQKMILDQRCEHATMNKPNPHQHPRRFKAWKIVNSVPFDVGIMAIIVLNIIQMGITFENQPILYTQLIDMSNYVFTLIFTVEMILKMQAYSWRYFETAWNKFDFFIVMASLLDIIISWTPTEGNEVLSVGPQIARIMRVLRVTRVIKLAGKNKDLQALMQTITLSVGPLSNVFLLLMLVLFIFSILAVFFFSSLTEGNVISEMRNFNDFGQSFLTLFVISTGENWNMLMYDCVDTPPNCEPGKTCGNSFAPAFFIIFVLFVQNVMLNLFILVIITQFETYYMGDDNPILKYSVNLEIFMKTWIEFTVQKYRCIKLREKQLSEFFKTLPIPFGLPPETTDDQMKKVMLKMGIRCDDGYVYFNELLYRCMRRQYGTFRLNRKLQIIELKTQYQIYNITLKQRSFIQKQEIYEQFFSTMIGNGKSSNPFLLQMYFHISFNTWLNYSRKCAKRERHYIKEEKKRVKAITENIAFYPVEFEEDEEQLIQVTVEIDEVVYYTSDEEQLDSVEAEEDAAFRNNNNKKSISISRSRTLNNQSQKSITRVMKKVGIAPKLASNLSVMKSSRLSPADHNQSSAMSTIQKNEEVISSNPASAAGEQRPNHNE